MSLARAAVFDSFATELLGEQGYVFVSASDRDTDRLTYTVGTAYACRIRRFRDAL